MGTQVNIFWRSFHENGSSPSPTLSMDTSPSTDTCPCVKISVLMMEVPN